MARLLATRESHSRARAELRIPAIVNGDST
jgi:hypothetical protein